MTSLLARGESIGRRLTATKGRARGFDYVRGTLALAVIASHSFLTSYGEAANREIWNGPWRPLIAVILPAFFALSGFLVAGSLLRSRSIHEFLTLRIVRLVPALFFEVLIAAMIVGPLLTPRPLSEYFADSDFMSYWLNIVGHIHFHLPGLFLDNPDPDMVNRQLWTIPVELRCYLAITVIAVMGGTRRPWRMAAILGACLVAFPVIDALRGAAITELDNVPGKTLILSFFSGILLFLARDRIPLSGWLFASCAAASWVLLSYHVTAYAACLPVAYVVVWLGLTDPPRSLLSRVGDYSYGLYIYGYVVQQAYSFLFPEYRVWWMNLLFTLAVASACAAVSWHCLEQPILHRRSAAVRAVDWFIAGIRRRLPARSRRVEVP